MCVTELHAIHASVLNSKTSLQHIDLDEWFQTAVCVVCQALVVVGHKGRATEVDRLSERGTCQPSSVARRRTAASQASPASAGRCCCCCCHGSLISFITYIVLTIRRVDDIVVKWLLSCCTMCNILLSFATIIYHRFANLCLFSTFIYLLQTMYFIFNFIILAHFFAFCTWYF